MMAVIPQSTPIRGLDQIEIKAVPVAALEAADRGACGIGVNAVEHDSVGRRVAVAVLAGPTALAALLTVGEAQAVADRIQRAIAETSSEGRA